GSCPRSRASFAPAPPTASPPTTRPTIPAVKFSASCPRFLFGFARRPRAWFALGLCYARLIHMLPAIDRQRRAGDEAGRVADQEHHAARDLLGVAEPADRNPRHDLLQHVLGHGAHHVGVDVAGRDGVDGHALARAFLRQRLGEAVDARFGGGVVDLAVLPGLAVYGTYVHDAPET